VADGVRLFKEIRAHTATSVPRWPVRLPQWYSPSLALLLEGREKTLLFAWQRDKSDLRLHPGTGITADQLVELYPRRLTPWTVSAEVHGAIVLHPAIAGSSARVYEIVGRGE
jgi:alpha-galactosidase